MIDREFVNRPHKPFDFANDFGDTYRWLLAHHKADLAKLLEELRVADVVAKLEHENDQLRQELDSTREHLKTFACFVASCERRNSHEWMLMCLDWLNGVCGRVSPESYFVLDGHVFTCVNKGDPVER